MTDEYDCNIIIDLYSLYCLAVVIKIVAVNILLRFRSIIELYRVPRMQQYDLYNVRIML